MSAPPLAARHADSVAALSMMLGDQDDFGAEALGFEAIDGAGGVVAGLTGLGGQAIGGDASVVAEFDGGDVDGVEAGALNQSLEGDQGKMPEMAWEFIAEPPGAEGVSLSGEDVGHGDQDASGWGESLGQLFEELAWLGDMLENMAEEDAVIGGAEHGLIGFFERFEREGAATVSNFPGGVIRLDADGIEAEGGGEASPLAVAAAEIKQTLASAQGEISGGIPLGKAGDVREAFHAKA